MEQEGTRETRTLACALPLELRATCSGGRCPGAAVHALGLCRRCYDWWRRHGDEIVVRRLREMAQRKPAGT